MVNGVFDPRAARAYTLLPVRDMMKSFSTAFPLLLESCILAQRCVPACNQIIKVAFERTKVGMPQLHSTDSNGRQLMCENRATLRIMFDESFDAMTRVRHRCANHWDFSLEFC
jgi:hypothetical protein